MLPWYDIETSIFPICRNSKNEDRSYLKKPMVLDTEATNLFKICGKWQGFDLKKSPTYYLLNCEVKASIPYIWMVGYNGEVYFGRHLHELPKFFDVVSKKCKGAQIFIYVHNFGYDFQHLRNVFDFTDVFAREKRKPMSARVEKYNLVFKDSLCLTQKPLAKLSTDFNLSVKKLTGDLDYLKVRGPETPLTAEEMAYCENDCLVLLEYLEKIELKKWKKLPKIPLTQTGKVRRAQKDKIKKYHWGEPRYALKDWRTLIEGEQNGPEVTKLLIDCYAGGYTHANALYTGQVLHDVGSFDFSSSYPAVCLLEKFPRSKFLKIDNFDGELDPNFAYILVLKLTGLKSTTCHSFLSESKCRDVRGSVVDNGRIAKAASLEVTLTDIDFFVLKQAYKIQKIEFLTVYRARYGYLPDAVRDLVYDFYKAKKDLKPLVKKDKEKYNSLYQESKQLLNAGSYGVFVTKTFNGLVQYDETGWVDENLTMSEEEERFNGAVLEDLGKNSYNYAWGVWIAAYARRNLWTMNLAIPLEVVYNDTDSGKVLNYDCKEVQAYISRYNAQNEEKLKAVCDSHPYFDFELLKGIGDWDFEGSYDDFLTLGAKKYVVSKENEIELTCAGVSKSKGSAALSTVEDFKKGFVFEYESSGRLLSCYNDNQESVIEFTDYLGQTDAIIGNRFGIVLQPTTYQVGVTDEYEQFVKNSQALADSAFSLLTT